MAATGEQGRIARIASHERKRISIIANNVRVKVNRRRVLRSMPREGVCAEIGVWKGDGASSILHNASPRKLFLVDPWAHQPERARSRYGRADADAMDEIYQGVLERFDAEIRQGRVEVLRGRSDDVWDKFEDSSLDWVWLDGDHAYDAVKRDLEALRRIVKPGGVIAGDDYTYGWWGNSVIRAVDEFVAEGKGSLKVLGDIYFMIQLGGPGSS